MACTGMISLSLTCQICINVSSPPVIKKRRELSFNCKEVAQFITLSWPLHLMVFGTLDPSTFLKQYNCLSFVNTKSSPSKSHDRWLPKNSIIFLKQSFDIELLKSLLTPTFYFNNVDAFFYRMYDKFRRMKPKHTIWLILVEKSFNPSDLKILSVQ